MRLHDAPSPARWPATRLLALVGALGLLGCGPEADLCTPELCSSHCCRENICEPAETCSTPVIIPVPDAGAPDAGVPDASVPDAGVPDAGVHDAGLPDAGPHDAGQWEKVYVQGSPMFEGVWGHSASDVRMIGSATGVWNGVALTVTGVSEHNLAIWGPAQDYWQVGEAAAITRVSGTYLSNESPRTTTSGFRAVTGTSSSDLWAIGGDLIYHSSGFGQWTAVPSNAPGVTLRGVWASSPTNAWAVGYSGVMLHWNGTAWSRAPNLVGGALLGIHGTSASNVWAVGVDGVVLHFDGQSWSVVPTGGFEVLNAVFAFSATDVWVTGTALMHYDGATWTSVSSSGIGWWSLNGLWGAPNGEVWAVGDFGFVLHRR